MPQAIERIAITGATGVIGGVLTEGLSSEFQITPIARRFGHDLRKYSEALAIIRGHQAVVHLA